MQNRKGLRFYIINDFKKICVHIFSIETKNETYSVCSIMEDMMEDIYHKALKSLTRSSFRSKFKLTYQDRTYIKEKGLPTIRKHAVDFITARISPRFPKNDGKQTPMKGHPVFVAQHATATCCRRCIQKWYGIKKRNALTHEEIIFVADLIMTWIEEQIKTGVDGCVMDGDAGNKLY